MGTVSLQLHPSIRIKDQPATFEGEFSEETIIEALNKLLANYPEVKEICLENGDKKPGILYISDKTELSSLGLLEEIVGDSNISIRIVPILHGG